MEVSSTTGALRMDDVGAASKRHEVYGVTRVRLGGLRVPFPGNFLFLKYLPPIKRWGPYRELEAGDWEAVLERLERRLPHDRGGHGGLGRGGRIDRAVPAQVSRGEPRPARRRRARPARGGQPRLHPLCPRGQAVPAPPFSGNRGEHREFYDWLPVGACLRLLDRLPPVGRSPFLSSYTTGYLVIARRP